MTNRNASIAPEICGDSYTHTGSSEIGLTKREYIAVATMQGLLASWGNHDVTDYRELAADAVLAADKLIEALNK